MLSTVKEGMVGNRGGEGVAQRIIPTKLDSSTCEDNIKMDVRKYGFEV